VLHNTGLRGTRENSWSLVNLRGTKVFEPDEGKQIPRNVAAAPLAYTPTQKLSNERR